LSVEPKGEAPGTEKKVGKNNMKEMIAKKTTGQTH